MASRLRRQALAWAVAKNFIRDLQHARDALTIPQLRELRGRALMGDVEGARDELKRLLVEHDRAKESGR